MKKTWSHFAALVLCIWLLPCQVSAADLLLPVGKIVGLELHNGTLTVAALDEMKITHPQELRIGDEILEINGKQIKNPEDISGILKETDGTVDVLIKRDGKEKNVRVQPKITRNGPRLGVYLRKGITGVGTVTWYNPETGAFGTLGHGVHDGTGNLLELTEGIVWPASVLSVEKGRTGKPGQLRGAIQGGEPLGVLSKNTAQGVFGQCNQGWAGEPLPIAEYQEIHTGEATILSTVRGEAVEEYSVEIQKIYPLTRENGRNFLIKVTDPELLEITGGIVQGMGVRYNRDNTGNP